MTSEDQIQLKQGLSVPDAFPLVVVKGFPWFKAVCSSQRPKDKSC